MTKPESLTLYQLYQFQYRPARQAGLRNRRRQPYISALNRFGRFLGREPYLADLTDDKLRQFVQWLDAAHGGKSSANTVAAIRSLWRFAAEAGYCGRPKYKRRNPRREPASSPAPNSLMLAFQNDYAPLRLTGRSPQTRHAMQIAIGHFSKMLGREALVTDLTDENLVRLLSFLIDTRQNSAITANKVADKLLALWRFLAKRKRVDLWPEVRKLPEPARIPQAWSLSQLSALLAAAEQEPGLVAGIPASDWWAGLLLVIWDTGERISAVLALEWADLELESGWLTIRAEIRKGKKKPLLRRLRPETVERLKRLYAPDRTLIFPWARDRQFVWKDFGPILRRAGLPHDRRSKFHRIRRSVASHFQAAGGDATALLDHTSRTVTLNYLDPRIVKETQAIDLLPPIDRKGGAA